MADKKIVKKKRHSLRNILIITLILLIVLLVGFTYFIGVQVVDGSTYLVDIEDTKGIKDSFFENYDMNYEEFCESYTIESISIESTYDGHCIPGELLYSEEKNSNTVIMVHGLGGNRYTNYPVAEFFLENGYNILTYDQRNTNENTAERNTFGYWEKYDLIDCINYIMDIAPEKQIGIWGTSFGGATAVLAMVYENTQQDIDFLILDCPLSNMEWMINEEMKKMNMGLPAEYMTWSGNLMNKIELGFSYKDASADVASKQITIPTLVINSRADEVTPFFMGEDIYKNLGSEEKELWTVDDSSHADVWLDHQQEYSEKILKLVQ